MTDLARAPTVLDRLQAMLSSASALTPRWAQAKCLLDPDDQVHIWVGEPDEGALQAMVSAFETGFNAPYPPILAKLLLRENGIAIDGERASGCERVAPDKLPEPALWPAGAYGDHWLLADLDLDPALDFYVIGEIADSGFVCLGVAHGEGVSGVYWLDRELAHVPPRLLAPDAAAFLAAWCDAALCLRCLLQRSGVPGWGS